MHRNTNASRAQPRASQGELRTIKPPRPDNQAAPAESLEELAASLVVSPDDLPLEIEDLAPHFLFEATQSSMPSSVPLAGEPIVARGPDAALREAFFDEAGGDREQLREFERIWKHIINRELVSTEL
jgi:hypothetical protein